MEELGAESDELALPPPPTNPLKVEDGKVGGSDITAGGTLVAVDTTFELGLVLELPPSLTTPLVGEDATAGGVSDTRAGRVLVAVGTTPVEVGDEGPDDVVLPPPLTTPLGVEDVAVVGGSDIKIGGTLNTVGHMSPVEFANEAVAVG